jgi:hypothetical protein
MTLSMRMMAPGMSCHQTITVFAVSTGANSRSAAASSGGTRGIGSVTTTALSVKAAASRSAANGWERCNKMLPRIATSNRPRSGGRR